MANGLFESPQDILARRRAGLNQAMQQMQQQRAKSKEGKLAGGLGQIAMAWLGRHEEQKTEEQLDALRTTLGSNQESAARAQPVAGSRSEVLAQHENVVAQQRKGAFADSGLDRELQGSVKLEDTRRRNGLSQEGLLKSAQAVYAENPELALKMVAQAKSMQGTAKTKTLTEAEKLAVGIKSPGVFQQGSEGKISQITGTGKDSKGDKDRYKTVGNAIFDVETQSWLVNPDKNSNINTTPIKSVITQGMVDALENIDQSMLGSSATILSKEDGSIVAAFPTQPKDKDISSRVEKLQIASLESENKARFDESRVTSTLKAFEDIPDFGGGIPLSFENAVKDNAGWRDAKSIAITQAKGFRAENAMKYLPPGPASDKDVALALSGQPDENAGKAEWVSYLTGIQKVNRLEANYFRDRTNFISNHGAISGFSQQQEAKRIDMAILNQVARPDGETHYSLYHKMPSDSQYKEATKKAFEQQFGFDPDRPAVLRKALDNLGL